jgi:hypothetical protein
VKLDVLYLLHLRKFKIEGFVQTSPQLRHDEDYFQRTLLAHGRLCPVLPHHEWYMRREILPAQMRLVGDALDMNLGKSALVFKLPLLALLLHAVAYDGRLRASSSLLTLLPSCSLLE